MLNIKPPKYSFCPFCGNKLGLTVVDRTNFKHCQGCNWTYYPHIGAAACGVAVRGKKVLLVKRAREPYKDTWMLPAGYVSYGEHPKDTVVREIAEETGYKAMVIKLLNIEQVGDDPRSIGHFGFFYQVNLEGKIKPADKEENSEIDWFDLKNLPPVGWHGHKNILKQLGGVFK